MVAVRIPGAENIEAVAPARPAAGPQATPEDFGAGIGASATKFGDALSSLGAHLYAKRQAAEDQTAKQTYEVEVAPRMAKAELDIRQRYPDGGDEYEAASNAARRGAHDGVLADLKARGVRLSDGAISSIDTSFAGRDMNGRVGAVTYNNNASIEKLKTVTNDNINSLSSQVMSGSLDVDAAIKQVDEITAASGHLYTGGTLEKFKRDARTTIQQAAVDNATAAKDPARARELNARYFGGTPAPGQTQADPLIRSESGGNPRLVNQLGYAGTYQFGAPRLETLGVYTPGPNENLDTWSKTAWNAPGKWTGTFNIEGFPEVKTLQDFRNNPEAQKAVFEEHMADIDEEATKRGLDKYVGQTVGGVKITQAGLRNMAHLGGIGGAENFLTSGGKINTADANGTTLSKYAAMGARTVADNPNTARALANNSRIDSMDAVNRVETTEAISDDLASMAATGQGSPTLTADRITRSLGPNAAAAWKDDRTRAKTFHDVTQDFATLPPEQMNARLISLAPKPGQDDYIAQDKLHTAAIKKADAIMALRKTDPAESVSADPEVKKAVAAYDPQNPETTKAIITARMAAQTRAGITAPSPLPVDETQRLLKPINEAVQMEDVDRTKGTGPSRIVLAQQQLVKDLKAKYGTNADIVMREVIGQAATARDRTAQADAAGKIMEALLTGKEPGAKVKRAAAVEKEANAVAKGFSFDVGTQAEENLRQDAITFAPPPVQPPKYKFPSDKSIAILRNAPAADQARLSGQFDQKFGPGAAAKILNQQIAPTNESPE